MTKIWTQSQIDETRTEALVSDYSNWELVRDNTRGVSRWVADESGPLTVQVTSSHPPDDYFDASGIFVVSDRLRTLMREFGVVAEFLPLQLARDEEVVVDDEFFCCNILEAVECFDFSQGECTFHRVEGFTDRIDKILHLAIDEEVASLHALFRIAKGGEYIVGVNDRLAEEIALAGLTGMEFIDPESWRIC